ncbi:MAG: hypothetical protein ABSE56_05460 [Bryobacteraceae bacterium]|jgi:hypothetical protein
MAEYLTRIGSHNASALFFARVPATELHLFRERFERIAETLQIP